MNLDNKVTYILRYVVNINEDALYREVDSVLLDIYDKYPNGAKNIDVEVTKLESQFYLARINVDVYKGE